MKFSFVRRSIIISILTLYCIVVPLIRVLAEDVIEDDDDDDDDMRLIAVRTFLLSPDPISDSVLAAIDTGMDSISDIDDDIVRRNTLKQQQQPYDDEDVSPLRTVTEQQQQDQRRLRCSLCLNFPPSYRGCWVNWVWTPRCRRTPRRHNRNRNVVTVTLPPKHTTSRDPMVLTTQLGNDNTNTNNNNNNNKAHRRYLQLAQQCQNAIDERDNEIVTATTNGIVPVLPNGASFVEECIYEEILPGEENLTSGLTLSPTKSPTMAPVNVDDEDDDDDEDDESSGCLFFCFLFGNNNGSCGFFRRLFGIGNCR